MWGGVLSLLCLGPILLHSFCPLQHLYCFLLIGCHLCWPPLTLTFVPLSSSLSVCVLLPYSLEVKYALFLMHLFHLWCCWAGLRSPRSTEPFWGHLVLLFAVWTWTFSLIVSCVCVSWLALAIFSFKACCSSSVNLRIASFSAFFCFFVSCWWSLLDGNQLE